MGGFATSDQCQKVCNYYPTKRDAVPEGGGCDVGGIGTSSQCHDQHSAPVKRDSADCYGPCIMSGVSADECWNVCEVMGSS